MSDLLVAGNNTTRRIEESTTQPVRTDAAKQFSTPYTVSRESREFGLHNTRLLSTESPVTAVEYRTLQDAYDYFDTKLFEGTLPQVLITLQRHRGAQGFFCPKRFRRRGQDGVTIHEVALNPDTFVGRTDDQILSTLAHEMVHVWQQEHGKPGRGGYHNRQWARKMHAIGLTPSDTGEPGGAMTGDRMSHYIRENGLFAATCRQFLQSYRLVWESAVTRADDPDAPGGPATQTRVKFTCPICGLNMWGKPGALIACVACTKETGEHIPMLPNDGSAGADPANGLSDPGDDRTPYDRVIRIMTEAARKVGRVNISREEFLPALADFTAATALIVQGEECLRAFITRMESRIDDWRAGTFPAKDAGHHPSAG